MVIVQLKFFKSRTGTPKGLLVQIIKIMIALAFFHFCISPGVDGLG